MAQADSTVNKKKKKTLTYDTLKEGKVVIKVENGKLVDVINAEGVSVLNKICFYDYSDILQIVKGEGI